jgi:hypothetical protein
MNSRKTNPSIRFYQACLSEAERRALATPPAGGGTSAGGEIALLRALIRRLGELLLQPLVLDEQIKISALLLRALASLAALLRLEAAQAQSADDELAQALQDAIQDEETLRAA